tara:strand:+ start:215 stop:502 length:288 start_codon:yes stop_codon:yes gene_type:complete
MALNSKGDQRVTVAGTPLGITVPTGASRCYIEIVDNSIYYTLDGDTPAVGNGGEAHDGDVIDLMGGGHHNMRSIMANISMVQQSAQAFAKVHYFD